MLRRYLVIMAGGLMIIAPVSAQSPADMWASPQTLTVKLSSFEYDPSTITLTHGAAYTLHLENMSSGGHDFQAKEFFAQAQIASADRNKVAKGKVAVPGKQSVDVTLIAPTVGTYQVHCTHFMHSAFGMTGRIVVQ